jgi:hypothetical protein
LVLLQYGKLIEQVVHIIAGRAIHIEKRQASRQIAGIAEYCFVMMQVEM